ncbi:S1C family serine protease [Limobrevibacterium gyesilva]|uniref:Serine protease n=1 Tax=Limobrevibacterium gyesilva TaxID=2991712 RepID=A0AA42CCJ7_9PROT|nr:serine protease [Limobrevibacterium gyesilva]MCW3473478.1 serine protease [Limobrevibacterium gyesilva]
MRHLLLLSLLIASPALAAKPPPLGADEVPAAPRPALAPRTTARPAATGTGFVVADGRALTNAHVVHGCSRVVARNAANRTAPARIDATDPRRDLALLSVPAGFGPPLAFRESPPVRRGDTVVTYGFPLAGLLSSGPTLTSGDISALAGLRDNPLHFQISAPVQPGNSGGPLLDAQGNVVGVVTSKLNAARIAQMTGGDIPQNVNFAVKGSEAVSFLAENGVRPRLSASAGPDRRTAEIGQVADPSTIFLQCFR